eukprot:m.37585 g.37585  ORF g.37585 m.37585 type:complete len:358 (+) comp32399_c0_seq2:47-1120(+)
MIKLKQKAMVLCSKYLGGAWRKITEEDFVFSEISGGLTNKLYRCTLAKEDQKQSGPNDVVYRQFNVLIAENSECLVRNVAVNLLAGERGVAPKTYAVFPEGQLEEFVYGRPLLTEELSVTLFSEAIAVQLARLHYGKDIPLSKEPVWFHDSVQEWLEGASGLEKCLSDPKDVKRYKEIERMLDIEKERLWIEKEILEKTDSPVVFCHNDLQEGNIMLLDKEKYSGKLVQLIDFEFSSYHYREFDFANHFREWSVCYNHSNPPYFTFDGAKFPTEEQQGAFIKAYLEEAVKFDPKVDPVEEQKKIQAEVKRFVLVSDFAFGIWSLAHAKSSTIQFDYIEYAYVRFNAYLQWKRDCLGC